MRVENEVEFRRMVVKDFRDKLGPDGWPTAKQLHNVDELGACGGKPTKTHSQKPRLRAVTCTCMLHVSAHAGWGRAARVFCTRSLAIRAYRAVSALLLPTPRLTTLAHARCAAAAQGRNKTLGVAGKPVTQWSPSERFPYQITNTFFSNPEVGVGYTTLQVIHAAVNKSEFHALYLPDECLLCVTPSGYQVLSHSRVHCWHARGGSCGAGVLEN